MTQRKYNKRKSCNSVVTWILSNSAAETVYCGVARITQLWPSSPVQAGYYLSLYKTSTRTRALQRLSRANLLSRSYRFWPAGMTECWGELRPHPFAIRLREQLCLSTEPNRSQCSLSVSSLWPPCEGMGCSHQEVCKPNFPPCLTETSELMNKEAMSLLRVSGVLANWSTTAEAGLLCCNGVSSSAKPNHD